MKKANPSLVQGHLGFFADAASDGNYNSITEWIKENIINENSSADSVNISAFFKAEKEFIEGCIFENDLNKIKSFLNAIDSEEFDKSNVRCRKLKLNQCKVLADAIKSVEEFLKENNPICESLQDLLKIKNGELKSLNLGEEEKDFRDKVLSTSIDKALRVAQVSSASSSKDKHGSVK